jgi:hypothetical protein
MPTFVIFPIRFILLVRKSRSQTDPWRRQQIDQFQPKTTKPPETSLPTRRAAGFHPFVRPGK